MRELAVECACVFAEVLQGDCSKDERSNTSLQAAANLRTLEVFHGSVPRNVIVSLPFSQARALDTVRMGPEVLIGQQQDRRAAVFCSSPNSELEKSSCFTKVHGKRLSCFLKGVKKQHAWELLSLGTE